MAIRVDAGVGRQARGLEGWGKSDSWKKCALGEVEGGSGHLHWRTASDEPGATPPETSTPNPVRCAFTTILNSRVYSRHYSDSGFWSLLRRSARAIGAVVVDRALLLYYALVSPNCPADARLVILGALGYLVLPVDLVPDFLPVVGFTDDAAVIAAALATVADHIDDDIRVRARAATDRIFG